MTQLVLLPLLYVGVIGEPEQCSRLVNGAHVCGEWTRVVISFDAGETTAVTCLDHLQVVLDDLVEDLRRGG